MTNKKLLKEISVEIREARAMYKQRHYRTMKACLLHIEQLIATNVKHLKG
jgi:Na+/H+-translocating membrane pyrophosphatase